MTRPLKAPWRDRSGKLSALKTITLALVLLPGLWTMAAFALQALGPRPLNEVIHALGLWAFRLLLVSLAITPMRRLLRWSKLIIVRRMVGVAAAAYGLLHLGGYMTDQAFDLGKIASEILLRIYLTIGMGALVGLVLLAATSTDGMIRRLGGRRWQGLHRAVYPLAALALLHYFMQSKLDITEPTLVAGVLAWLLGYRILAVRSSHEPAGWSLAALGIAVAGLTVAGEAAYFHLLSGVDPGRIVMANLSLATGPRPACILLAAGLGISLLAALRRFQAGRRVPSPRGPWASRAVADAPRG